MRKIDEEWTDGYKTEKETRFAFDRNIGDREKDEFNRKITNEIQEQREQVVNPEKDYASIGSDVRKVLEKAAQLDPQKETQAASGYGMEF